NEYPNAPIGHSMQPSKGLMDPRMENPYIGHNMPPNVSPMPPFGAHQSPSRPPHAGPPGHAFSGHYYPPVADANPYYARPPSRHDTPPPFSSQHIRPQTNSPMGAVPPPRTTAPTTSPLMPG